ncbi:unnamed protein product, partial [Prorocentrum cordatum]
AKAPWHVNAVRALLVLGPLVELLAAIMCWGVYKDHLANLSSDEAFLLNQAEVVSGAVYGTTGGEADDAAAPREPGGRPTPAGFSAFQGTARRLSGARRP